MDHTLESLAAEQHAGGGVKEIWKVTIILTVLTLVELGFGFMMMGMDDGLGKHFIKGVICIFYTQILIQYDQRFVYGFKNAPNIFIRFL